MACKLDNPADAQRCNIAVNRWAGRAIPSLLAGTVGYANYVLVYQLCGLFAPTSGASSC